MKIEELLSKQSYLKQRLSKYRKSLPFEDALNFGFKWCYVKRSRDVVMPPYKKAFPYEIYDKLSFVYTTSKNGDCYDRFLVAD